MGTPANWLQTFVMRWSALEAADRLPSRRAMQFATTRSALGELVYKLKYRNGPLNDIVETAVAFVTEAASMCSERSS